MAQGAVWDSVAESSHRAGVRSETGALDHVYAGRRASLEERAARFPSEPGQVGVLAFLDGAPVGLDLLPGIGIYAKVHDRLVRGVPVREPGRGRQTIGRRRGPDDARRSRPSGRRSLPRRGHRGRPTGRAKPV